MCFFFTILLGTRRVQLISLLPHLFTFRFITPQLTPPLLIHRRFFLTILIIIITASHSHNNFSHHHWELAHWLSLVYLKMSHILHFIWYSAIFINIIYSRAFIHHFALLASIFTLYHFFILSPRAHRASFIITANALLSSGKMLRCIHQNVFSYSVLREFQFALEY